MKAFLITMAILLIGIGVISVVWWLTRRASPPTAAPVSPAVSPDTAPGEPDAGPEAPEAAAAPEEPVLASVPPQPANSAATPQTTAADPAPAAEAAPAPEPAPPGPEAGPESEVPAGPYGPGSARPLPDGSAPSAEFTVKGNASSRLYHAPESPYYKRTRAEAWFRTAEDAEAAGFQHWNSRRRRT
ncbi:MAG: hypothetical protein GEU94_00655 [Micromonosporaceae bacterium]|nr:hypothetical protein [Micromonosporaceae bacterium]